MKQKFLSLFIVVFFTTAFSFFQVFAEPMYSPTWGFSIDLPQGYYYVDGNSRDRFTFEGPSDTLFDIRVYNGEYSTIEELITDVNRRLGNQGATSFFNYRGKIAAIIELKFSDIEGWGLCVELTKVNSAGTQAANTPFLLALSYGPAGKNELHLLHMSVLDSIAPSPAERLYPGPIMEFGFPRGERKLMPIAKTELSALFYENDAEAAQVLIDREFEILKIYQFSGEWEKAWIRFYRAIYRDSWDRVADAAFRLERHWNARNAAEQQINIPGRYDESRALAESTLNWVQSFKYERDLAGSDFVNLVTAVTEGRGDCDSRALLWAMILNSANIRSGIMVSRNHSHAMGLTDVDGPGARFEAGGVKWLVAETTTDVGIGLIAQSVSDIESWLGVFFTE